MQALQEQLGKDYRPSSRGSRGRRSGHVSSATEDESSSVTGKIPQTAVAQLQEQLNSIGKPPLVKKREPKVGRIGKDEWNVKMLEERLRQQQKRQKEPKVEPEKPQILRDIFQSKRNVMDERLKADGKETETDRARFTHIDERLQRLDRQLKEGSLDGLFFHRNCFRCEFCQCSLRLGNYAYDSTIAFKGKFYCTAHFRMERPSQRWQEMMKRKQAFLSANPEPPSLMPAKPANTEDNSAKSGQLLQAPDAGVVTFQPKTYKTPRQLSAEEMATLVDVDSTPERVEFENTLELLSEDELLTSELEEEELAQKNLGAVEVPTSDDEYSDYSSDEGTDSESLVEEIEHSLNLDDTRHMAETWQRKHASSLDVATGTQDEMGYEVGNGVGLPRSPTKSPGADDEEESDEEDDEETSTEDATSHDVDSDEEYSPPDMLSDDYLYARGTSYFNTSLEWKVYFARNTYTAQYAVLV
ncbi:hypothetical protein MRX96_038576 [Rhipicephalus microplus]